MTNEELADALEEMDRLSTGVPGQSTLIKAADRLRELEQQLKLGAQVHGAAVGLSEHLASQPSFLDGYLQALDDYAVWNNGKRHVGCGFYSLEDAKKEAEKKYK